MLTGIVLLTQIVRSQNDSINLEKIRTESGVDPTRVSSKASYTILFYDKAENASQINNKATLNLGVNRWSFSIKPEIYTIHTGEAGSGFKTAFGDMKFSILNAFYVKGKEAFAGSVEFSVPTSPQGFGSQYFSATPAITFSHTFKPSLIFAIQPQYTFALAKDSAYPSLSVLTIRAFIANFNKSGFFFVLEPRPIYNFQNEEFDFIISPIIGKALGAGFNLVFISEIPTKQSTIDSKGVLYQVGFNKNF